MDTILLLMDKTRDRHLLQQHLQDRYTLITLPPGAPFDTSFDLCITDGPALNRYREQIAVCKAADAELCQPVLLITARREVSLLTSNIWQVIDEVITTPIHKAELQARVEVLLRARRLSLELLAQKNQHLQVVQSELLASERKFAILFAKSSFAAALSRLSDGVLVDVNEEFERIYGIPRSEAIGKTTAELGINLDPERRAQALHLIQSQGFVHDLEVWLRVRTGEMRLFSVNLDQVEIEGERYILNIARDVTDRRQAEEMLAKSEQRFRSLFQNNHAVMLVIDPTDGRISDANPARRAHTTVGVMSN